jgi:Amt family ammonium transporter
VSLFTLAQNRWRIDDVLGVTIALVGGFLIYGVLKKTIGLRLDPEDEFNGADLAIHRISASPERETNW